MTLADGARVRTVFIGTGEFGVPALRVLAGRPDVVLVAVVTSPPRPAGRRSKPRRSPIQLAASDLGPPILTPERLRAPDAVHAILARRPDLLVLADYGQIVPKDLLDVPLGALNLHPSLLPRHRGAIPVPATIVGGDAVTGVTLMRMDAGLDTGPILAVDQVRLKGDEVAPELERDLADVAATLLARTLQPWIRGELAPEPQSARGATLTRSLRREDGRLEPAAPVETLERQVRAFQPWPGSWIEIQGGRLTIWRAHIGSTVAPMEPGRLRIRNGVPALSAADGTLVLDEVQPAGGRRMSGEAFARGRPGLDALVQSGPPRPPFERPVG